MRNEEECFCSVPNCCDTVQRSASQPAGQIIKEMPGSVASGTPYIKYGKEKFVPLHFWKEHRKPGIKRG